MPCVDRFWGLRTSARECHSSTASFECCRYTGPSRIAKTPPSRIGLDVRKGSGQAQDSRRKEISMTEFAGTWWLGSDSGRKVGGILTLEDSGLSTLKLTQTLIAEKSPNDQATADDARHDVIHGSAGGTIFTVINPLVVGIGIMTFPFEPSETPQTLRPEALIDGAHLADGDERRFEAVELQIDNLTMWSGISGVHTRRSPHGFPAAIEIALPEGGTKTATLGDTTVALVWQGTADGLAVEFRDGRRVGISETVTAKITRSGAHSWHSFLAAEKSLRDLLTFATRHPCAIRSCRLIEQGANQFSRTITLHRAFNVAPESNAKAERVKCLFTLADNDFETLLRKWDDLREAVGMGVDVLFGLDYQTEGYLENKLLNVASAAESIHRALAPNERSLEPALHVKAMEEMRAAISDDAARKWFTERLKNVPGFKERMLSLASMASTEAITNLVSDIDTWSKWLKNARNAIAHLEGEALDRLPREAQYFLTEVTAGVLHLVFLNQLGISSETQLQATNQVYGFAAGRFRAFVRRQSGNSVAT